MYDLPLMFMRDTDAPAFVLLAIVMKHFGTQCFEWEPEMLRLFIKEDYSVELTDLQSDKIQAAMLVLTTNMAETHWKVFETVCHIFNNQSDDLDTVNPLEAEEIAMALAEIDSIRHVEQEALDYDDEVNVYVGSILADYGMCKPPKFFPSAILPVCNECDDSEKHEALQELYDARKKSLVELADRLAEMHAE